MTAPYLKVVTQRHPADCGVAVLAMLLNRSYEEVLLAFRHNVMQSGSTIRQLKAASKRLGVPLTFHRGVKDLEGKTGILSLRSPKWKTEHVVLLKDGLIFDTDATVWEPDTFLATYEAKPLSLLTAEL